MNLAKNLLTLVAVLSVGCVVSAQETEISRRDVPPAVLAAFERAYPNAKVLEWEKEIHGGKLYYEAETADGKVARNILFLPDGTVAQVEENIAVKDIPAAVADVVKREYSHASIHSAEKVTSNGVTEYALQLKGANQRRIAVRSDGTIASREGKKPIDRVQ